MSILKLQIPKQISNQFFGICTTACIGVGAGLMMNRIWKPDRSQYLASNENKLIAISGCDSGLGLSMAYWARKAGFNILAGCYDENSDGACYLKSEFQSKGITVVKADVTLSEDVKNFRLKCEEIVRNEEMKLWAVVPNAAIAVFGEYFWHTKNQSKQIMDVNFHGSVDLVHALHHLILRDKSRIIVISSDCANVSLPFLSVYCASKAALQAWTDAIRLEVAKYGVSVASLQPGNFPTKTNLFSGQARVYREMENKMTEEDKIFFGDYFHNFNQRIINVMKPTKVEILEDDILKKAFFDLLTGDIRYKPLIRLNPKMLTLIHFLVQNSPTRFGDFLLSKLVSRQEWTKVEYPKKLLQLSKYRAVTE